MGAGQTGKYHYGYHKLNDHHGFRFLLHGNYREALGLGSAYGDEFIPVANRIGKITILEPSDTLSGAKHISGTPCEYIKPSFDGNMPFMDNQFDLILCLGVMHHIPNVSYVMKECFRCLNQGGIMLMREPIVSMGDWRKPRAGLTKRERGIPLQLFNRIIENAGFTIKRKSLCYFPLIPKMASKLGFVPFNNSALTLADAMLSQLFSWNVRYHRTKWHHKLAPSSVYYILQK